MSKFREDEIVEEITLKTSLEKFEKTLSSIGVTYDKSWDEEDNTWYITFPDGEDVWVFSICGNFVRIV